MEFSGIHSQRLVFISARVAIHERSHGLKVAMHITEYLNLPLLGDLLDEVLCCPENRLKVGRWLLPFPVLIEPCQISPLIAVNDSVDV